MLRTLVIVACLLTAVPAQAMSQQNPPDMAQREAAARDVFVPSFKEGMRPPLEQSLASFPRDELHPEELTALQAAHARAVEIALAQFSDKVVPIVARHVPLEQLQPASDVATPEWQAALAEIQTLVETEAVLAGVELAVGVIETACKVRRDPSAACISLLTTAADYRSGRLSIPGVASR